MCSIWYSGNELKQFMIRISIKGRLLDSNQLSESAHTTLVVANLSVNKWLSICNNFNLEPLAVVCLVIAIACICTCHNMSRKLCALLSVCIHCRVVAFVGRFMFRLCFSPSLFCRFFTYPSNALLTGLRIIVCVEMSAEFPCVFTGHSIENENLEQFFSSLFRFICSVVIIRHFQEEGNRTRNKHTHTQHNKALNRFAFGIAKISLPMQTTNSHTNRLSSFISMSVTVTILDEQTLSESKDQCLFYCSFHSLWLLFLFRSIIVS